MRRSRVLALGAIGILAATGAALAQSRLDTGGFTMSLPIDFRPLARLSAEADPSAEVPVTRRGWGDPADGCAAVVHESAIPGGSAEALARGMGWQLALAGWALEERAREREEGRTDVTYAATGPVDGLLRVVTEAENSTLYATAALCFWTEREPTRCGDRCRELIESLEVRR